MYVWAWKGKPKTPKEEIAAAFLGRELGALFEGEKWVFQHEKKDNYKDEWLTPPELIKSLEFDLDPCSPGTRRPWDTAKNHYAIGDGQNGARSPLEW